MEDDGRQRRRAIIFETETICFAVIVLSPVTHAPIWQTWGAVAVVWLIFMAQTLKMRTSLREFKRDMALLHLASGGTVRLTRKRWRWVPDLVDGDGHLVNCSRSERCPGNGMCR